MRFLLSLLLLTFFVNVCCARPVIVKFKNISTSISAKKEAITLQYDAVNLLQAEGISYESFWIVNCLVLDADPILISKLLKFESVEYIIDDVLMYPLIVNDVSEPFMDPYMWNLETINIRGQWDDGFYGQGTVVCNFDTGVDVTHPALQNSFRGDINNDGDVDESWFDYDGVYTSPYDSAGFWATGHGTHTMGTMVGAFGEDTVGVAPGAKWIAAKVSRDGSDGLPTAKIFGAFEWVVQLNNPPDVINCSWGSSASCSSIYWSMIDFCESLGIAVIFAAGNNYLSSPSDRASDNYTNFAVGATDTRDSVTAFSGRGPTWCNVPYGDPAAFKPEIVAPGNRVRSTIPHNRYGRLSGTSMASPHVCGLVALLRQEFPWATVNKLKWSIMDGARDLGDLGEDNDSGHGIIDGKAARQSLYSSTVREYSVSDSISSDINEERIPNNYEYLSIYPNPTNKNVIVVYKPCQPNTMLEIYNVLGQLVHLQVMTSTFVTLDVGNYATGIYFCRVYNITVNITKTFTVLK